MSLLFEIGAALLGTNVLVPALYYTHMTRKYLRQDWSLAESESVEPSVAIIVPTFNESELIEKKLQDILRQTYRKDRIQLVVVDGKSTDSTVKIVRKWTESHPELKTTILEERERKGMVHSLNLALSILGSDSEIVAFTDADSELSVNCLEITAKYFRDQRIGALTCNTSPSGLRQEQESAYRVFYNSLRIAESKADSTPILNGTWAAFRHDLLKMIGGIPTFTGNADSTPASVIGFAGFRSVQAEEAMASEPVRNQNMRKIRRAQHLLLSFWEVPSYSRSLGLSKPSTAFIAIWRMEFWLHVVNPWLLFLGIGLLVTDASSGDSLAAVLLLAGGLSLILRTPRVWFTQQLYLVAAALRNVLTHDLMWTREPGKGPGHRNTKKSDAD